MKILDIGCNSGIIDLLIAVRYQPKLIIGIDIDHRMIKSAIDNMQKVINDEEQMSVLVN
jgi:tRNA1(Val) A37 N6-methylase TrmN6